jgi:signal transduction histidine kinase
MEDQIDKVVTLSREGSQLTDPARVSLRDAATAAWSTVRSHEAEFNVGKNLGVVESTKERLRALFTQLFANALEHTAAPARIRVGCTANGF